MVVSYTIHSEMSRHKLQASAVGLTCSANRESEYILDDRASLQQTMSPLVMPAKPKPHPKCLISVLSPARMWWDSLVLCMAVWNCFYVPFGVAFLRDEEPLPLYVVDLFIDAAYLADILVFMRSTYIDLQSGEEVTDTRKITKKYVTSSRFFVDVLSGIPLDVIGAATGPWKLIGIVKVLRLLRLRRLLMFMQAKARIKLTLKLLHLLFLFIIYLHVIACLWFLLTSAEEVYIPPGQYIYHEGKELYSESIWRQYAFSLYMSAYMLTAAEIGPRTPWECIFSGAAVLLGQLFQGFMFSEITVVLFELNEKSGKLREIQNDTHTAMTNMGLSMELKGRVVWFLLSMQGAILQQSEYQSFFSVLPPSLKHEVHAHLYQSVLVRNPALSPHNEIASEVLKFLNVRHCQPEEKVIAQGDLSDSLYFISEGKCYVELLDKKQPVIVKFLLKGAHFGEIGAVFDTPRTATVVAIEYVTLAELTKKDFDIVSENYPQFRTLMRKSALRYNDPHKQFQLTTLRRCAYFSSLPDKSLSELLYILPMQSFDANECIFREGEHPQGTYFILDGEVEVSMNVRDKFLIALDGRSETLYRNKTMMRMRKERTQMAHSHRINPSGKLMKLVLEELGSGSVITPVSPILNACVHFEVRATRLTSMLVLTKEHLQAISAEHRRIYKAWSKFAMWLGLLSKTGVNHMLALDFVKSHSETTPLRRVPGKDKLRRIILGKLAERRKMREIGFNDISSMSNKLKAIATLGEIEDKHLLEKIRVGVAPESTKLIEAYQMLELVEVSNPLLTQFAIQSAKVLDVVQFAKQHLQTVHSESRRLTRDAAKTKAKFEEIKTLGELLVRVKEERRFDFQDWL